MQNDVDRKPLQFSLTTAIALMFVAAIVVGVNTLSFHVVLKILFDVFVLNAVGLAFFIRHRRRYPDAVLYTGSDWQDLLAFLFWAMFLDLILLAFVFGIADAFGLLR